MQNNLLLAVRALLNPLLPSEKRVCAEMASHAPSYTGPPQKLDFQGLLFDMDGVSDDYCSFIAPKTLHRTYSEISY